MEKKITFVIGGCRSGKSSWALGQANNIGKDHKVFIATSVPTDTEMRKRVDDHQHERGNTWETIEEPVHIHRAIDRVSQTADVILVDCLTLWVSNLMLESDAMEMISSALDQLGAALDNSECPVFLVSNEVGLGIVPDNAVARKFRDLAGYVNQWMAKKADCVVMTVAGIDIQIKPEKNQDNS